MTYYNRYAVLRAGQHIIDIQIYSTVLFNQSFNLNNIRNLKTSAFQTYLHTMFVSF